MEHLEAIPPSKKKKICSLNSRILNKNWRADAQYFILNNFFHVRTLLFFDQSEHIEEKELNNRFFRLM